jgi:hypothetical protein
VTRIRRGSRRIKVQLAAKRRATETPFLRSRTLKNEWKGYKRHSGRSINFMRGDEDGRERAGYACEFTAICQPNNTYTAVIVLPASAEIRFRLDPCVMSNYFSNHSQPRLFANATASQTPSATATATTTVTQPAQRPRLSSKHFSTSVSGTSPLERSKSKEQLSSDGAPSLRSASPYHPLRNTYVRAIPRV